jgi:hypothetical protein
MPFGTNTVLDTLLAYTGSSVLDYGEDRLLDAFQSSLNAHNALVQDMIGPLVEFTSDRVRRYGSDQKIDMIEADEYTRADAQKVSPNGVDIGFPLRPYQVSLQWTRKHLQVSTPADLAKTMIAAQRADLANVRKAIQRALFTPTNNLTYRDRMIDNVTLPLRALLNADGAAIPEDDFGNTFDGATHTHYLGTASFVAADVEAAVNTVVEHGVNGPVLICINKAQQAAISGFANFDPLLQVNIQPGGGSTADQVINKGTLAPFDVNNRMIGVWNGAVEVWVKPWVYANYVVVIESDPVKRPLVHRTRAGSTGMGELRLVAENEQYPLRAETMEREFGVSVWGREQAAILYTANAVYAAPVIV